jgi:hypothetical protein
MGELVNNIKNHEVVTQILYSALSSTRTLKAGIIACQDGRRQRGKQDHLTSLV